MMDKNYNHNEQEPKIADIWYKDNIFKADNKSTKKSYTIILPPPNASGKMHIGNALMIAIEDLLIRWKRMCGYEALWIPGTDHAGIETQTTFERELKKQGKSRFDFDRETLYKMIYAFVLENKSLIESQLKSLGGSYDFSRYVFMLDDKSLKTVYSTFFKMYNDGLIYRGNYLVNYSFKWGTSFSDAEITYKEQIDPLFFIKFQIKDSSEYLTVATVRPETIFVDKVLAINPKDEKYKKYLGKILLNPLTNKEMTIIEDSFVDMEFGTGVVKVTPAHDKNDFEVARRHNLEVIPLIETNGKLNEKAQEYEGFTILKAREAVVEKLKKEGKIDKVDENYKHTIPVDYRTNDYIENLMMPNWFIKVEKLKVLAKEVLEKGELNIYPKWRKNTYLRWVENMHDWAISRQNVWGIRVPVYYSILKNPNIQVSFKNKNGEIIKNAISEILKNYSILEVKQGLQQVIAPSGAEFVVSDKELGDDYLPETDTFDTWFSSGQWPLITTNYPDGDDFKYFYPLSVLETGWEIVTRWVSRMVMFGVYLTGKSPFKDVYLHGHVRALDGRKMSKGLGNVINPEEYIEKFGVDAFRMGLISGTANGKDFRFPHDKVLSYRNFANKLWNMARFLEILIDQNSFEYSKNSDFSFSSLANEGDKKLVLKFNEILKAVDTYLTKYKFAQAGDTIYHFLWDDFASIYLEDIKLRENKIEGILVFIEVFKNSLKMLHPFMPFVTESLWSYMPKKGGEGKILALESYPVEL